ncbi:MAG TPA: fused MFS/spermidine synthase, partial [Rubrobacteraceae bacterium]|nr:fused MFS/spermidine synthase [Rubrobacteraceae bacterium]
RPAARHLTEFYLWVAVGGVLGGVFNALIAPITFDTVVEYPLVIVLACLLLPGVVLRQLLQRGRSEEEEEEQQQQAEDRQQGTTIPPALRRLLDPRSLDVVLPLALGVAVAVLSWAINEAAAQDWRLLFRNTVLGLGVGLCLYFAYSANRPIRFGLGIAALIVAGTLTAGSAGVIYQDRSFFGVYKVIGTERQNILVVGDTNHGAQIFDGSTPPVPSTYHHPTGPIGQLFDALPDETATSPFAVLGLGTGSMACYAQPGQQMTFYEIDPLVEKVARDTNLFTFLRDCPGELDVVLGDGRLSLGDTLDGEYGVIVADAFSSDAVPVHLMTREALELYLSKLKSDGAMAYHITNRYLRLEPVLGNLARDRGLVCYTQSDINTRGIPFKVQSHWVVMAREDEDLGNVPDDQRWRPCLTTDDPDEVWTDSFSNILSTFKWR